MSTKRTPGPWVRFNQNTACYETPDGTRVAAEVVECANCIADIVLIAAIREEQRAAIAKATGSAS